MALFPVEQIEWGTRRNIEQLGIFLFSLHPGMNVSQGGLEIMGHMLVELLVLLGFYLALGACPQRTRLIDRLVLDGNDIFIFFL